MVFTPPQNIAVRDRTMKSVFLAGSIEMGAAEDWQTIFYSLRDVVNIFNPRRKDWDPTWLQDYEYPQFYQQVQWELNALDKADYIIMYFDPNTKSPISLLELGLYANSKKMMVVCPEGFWRRGNVQIVCDKYNIPMFDTLFKAKKQLIKLLEN